MNADLNTLVTQMGDVFSNSKQAGLVIVGGAIAIGIIFVAARWAWARLRQWLAKAG
jgi:hypothetical protein